MSYLKHKPGSIEELMANEATKLNDNAYQDMFKKELDKAGKGIGGMSPKEKKDFFNKIDSKYKAKNEEVQESASQVQVKRDGKGNFNLMLRGKEIGYYHKSGSKYMVYYDKDGDDYDQSDEVSSEMQAKKLAYDNMNEVKVDELTKAQEKLPPALQKAIKDKETKKEEDAYDKDDEKPAKPKPKKEDLDAKELQTKKTDNYKSKNESWKQAWEAATHKMPDGTMMKGAKHKDEALDSKDTETVKDVVNQLKGATKAHSAQAKDLEKAMKNEADDVDNGDEKKDTKKKLHADSGSKLTKVETEPSVDYKN